MNLIVSVWFKSKLGGDLKESLRDTQLIGRWPLREMVERDAKDVYTHQGNLKLPDGSDLQFAATHNCIFQKPSLSLSVASGETAILHTSSINSVALSAMAATGCGGYLEIRITPIADA